MLQELHYKDPLLMIHVLGRIKFLRNLLLRLVSHSQTAFFCFSLWWQKKGSGDLTIEFPCDEIDRFC